jgi:hypothetical protein
MLAIVKEDGYVKLPHITVGQLIDALSGLDPNLPVSVEGCDCTGDAAGVTVIQDDPDGPYALIFRDNESIRQDVEDLVDDVR